MDFLKFLMLIVVFGVCWLAFVRYAPIYFGF